MSELRTAELSGSWYPSTAEACERFFASVKPSDLVAPAQLVGAIVPHAGWSYSGGVAFGALRRLADSEPGAELVLVFGGHLVASDAPRVLLRGGWSTPFGPAILAEPLAEDIAMALESEVETPDEYYEDNGIEVLMPMVKRLWPNARVITVGIPPVATATKMGVQIVELAKGRGFDRIVAVGSTDLTHYGPNYSFQPKGRGRPGLDWVKSENDPAVLEAMLKLQGTDVIWIAQRARNACCPGAAAAAIAASKKLGANTSILASYTTSFDVQPREPEPSSFVGYAGVLFGRNAS